MDNSFSDKHNTFDDFANELQSTFAKGASLIHQGRYDDVISFHDGELKEAFRDVLDAQTRNKIDHEVGESLYKFFGNLEKQILSNNSMEIHKSMRMWNADAIKSELDFQRKRLGYSN